MFFHDYGGSGGIPETASKKYPKKTPKVRRSQTISGSYFGSFFAQNQIRRHFFGVYFYGYFCYRFWEASGTNLKGFCVISGSILGSFCHFVGDAAKLQKCNTSQAKTLFSGVLGRPFYIIFANFFKFVLCCSQDSIFVRFLQIWASKGGPCSSQFSKILQILHEKKSAEIEA